MSGKSVQERGKRQARTGERAEPRHQAGRPRARTGPAEPVLHPGDLADERPASPSPVPAVTRIQRALVIQRDVDTDLADGFGALEAAENYGGTVTGKITPYSQIISGLDDTHDQRYEQAAQSMASGFRVWAENYYNKSQAYLYEAELASDNTTVRQNLNRFAVLGVDTDENPDLDVISQYFDVSSGVPREGREEKHAIEVKASTSDKYKTMDDLARKGMQQLQKRAATGNYHGLVLELHNDNDGNHWPLTDHMFLTNFGDDIDNVEEDDWNDRLETVMDNMKTTYGIGLPVTIGVKQSGATYGRVVV